MILINIIWLIGVFIISLGLALFQSNIFVAPVAAIAATLWFIYLMKKGEINIKEIPGFGGATFCMILGHIGTLSIFHIYSLMETGGASGLFFVPSILWMGFWYSLTMLTVAFSSIFPKKTPQAETPDIVDCHAQFPLRKDTITS